MATDDHDTTRREFGEAVTMTAGELETWLDTDDDHAPMREVHGYVQRHLAQEPAKEDVETSRWRYSLMNWGHDPVK